MLESIQRDIGTEPRFSVIWLHGLGADGHDFEPIVPELQIPPEIGVRFIFPHAPQQPVTINGGMMMPAWYDVLSMEIASQVDEVGIGRSSEQIRSLIDLEIERGISSDRILLAGFSQGGAIALHTGLLYDKPLLGILALSTYLPLPARLEGANRTVPIFMGHGTHDPVIPMVVGQGSYQMLDKQGYDVEWHSYPMEHSVNMEEIRDVGVWMTRLFRNN